MAGPAHLPSPSTCYRETGDRGAHPSAMSFVAAIPGSLMATRAPQAHPHSPGRSLATSLSSPSCRDLLCSHHPSDTVAMPPPQTRPPASPSPETATRRTTTVDFVHPEHQIERSRTESPPSSSSSTSCTAGRHRQFARPPPSPASPTTSPAPW